MRELSTKLTERAKHTNEKEMSLKYNKNLISRAKELRKNITPQEKHLLYDFLSKHQVRFQRQKTIDNYIVDFYCHKAKLVIEINVSQYYTKDGIEYDEEHTKVLEICKLKVLRFTNTDIDKKFNSVCKKINYIIKNR